MTSKVEDWAERILGDVRDRVVAALDGGNLGEAVAMAGWRATAEGADPDARFPTWEELSDEERARLTALSVVQIEVIGGIVRAHQRSGREASK